MLFCNEQTRIQPILSPACASATYGSAWMCRRKNMKEVWPASATSVSPVRCQTRDLTIANFSNWTIRKIYQLHLILHANIFVSENAFENICKLWTFCFGLNAQISHANVSRWYRRVYRLDIIIYPTSSCCQICTLFFSINEVWLQWYFHGPLTRYADLQVVHAPGMPGTFSPSARVSDPGMHHGMCVTRVPWCMPGSLTSSFVLSRWRGKRSWHSRRICNPQFYVSSKRPKGRIKAADVYTSLCAVFRANKSRSVQSQWILTEAVLKRESWL